MNEEIRADSFEIKSIADKIDQNGYLRIKGTMTRAGIFSYPQRDGSVRRELRHPDDVMRADSIDTLRSIPIAPLVDHKLTMLNLQMPNDTDNIKPIGVTGENIVKTPDYCLDGGLTIHDKQTISDLIQREKVGKPLMHISAAYKVGGGLDETPGSFDGKPYGLESGDYDAIQKPPFVYGHVTLVEKGRAGSRCSTRADSAGDLENSNEDEMDPKKIREIPALTVGSGDNIFRADALEYEENEDTRKLVARLVKTGTALKKAHVRADEAEGALSVLKKDKEELEKKVKGSVSQEQYRADLNESLELIKKAKEIGVELKDDMTPKGIKIAICAALDKNFDVVRADSDEGFLSGFLSGSFGAFSTDLKRRVSDQKTLNNLYRHQKREDAVDETEYESEGII